MMINGCILFFLVCSSQVLSQIEQTDPLRDNHVRLIEIYNQDTTGKQKLSSHIYVNEFGGYDHEIHFRNGTTSDTLSEDNYVYNDSNQLIKQININHDDSLFDHIETYTYDSSGRVVVWETIYANKPEYNEKSILRHDTMFHSINGEMLRWFIIKNHRHKSIQVYYTNGLKSGRAVERWYKGVRKRVHKRRFKNHRSVYKSFFNTDKQLILNKSKDVITRNTDDERLKPRTKHKHVNTYEYLESGLVSSIRSTYSTDESYDHTAIYKYVFRE